MIPQKAITVVSIYFYTKEAEDALMQIITVVFVQIIF